MAIFGSLDMVESQVNKQKFIVAFEYLKKVVDTNSLEHKRLVSYPLDSFEKIDLDENNFALEQVYDSKERSNCFFESHKQYIDVQFILEGEEIIEVAHTNNLNISMPYSEEMDLLKYDDILESSKIILKKGNVAIFYPEDVHMPCVKLGTNNRVLKTVIKVAV